MSRSNPATTPVDIPPGKAPLVSVIVAAYGQERYIADTLESLQAMTLADWEAVVVDDGSPDGVMRVAERYAAADPRIRLLHTANHGVGAARNAAVASARGRYITFLDGDDLFYPDYLSRATAILESDPQVTLVYGMWEYFGATAVTPPLDWYGYGTLLLANSIHVSAVMRRADFISAGGFDTSLRSHEDWELWIRLLHGRPDSAVRFLPSPSLRYRQKPASRNAASLASETYPAIVRAIYAKHRHLYDATFRGLVTPPIISMGGEGGPYRWTALRPLDGLSRPRVLDSALMFSRLLDFVVHNQVLPPAELREFARRGFSRFKGHRLWLATHLRRKELKHIIRQCLTLR